MASAAATMAQSSSMSVGAGTQAAQFRTPFGDAQSEQFKRMLDVRYRNETIRSIRSLWEEGTKNRRWKETAYATGYRMYSLMGPHELTRNALSLWVNLQVADMFRLSGDLAVSGSVSVGLFSSSY